MAVISLRVRFVGGHLADVTFEGPDHIAEEQVIDHVINTLAQDAGIIRCAHGGRLVVLYGRGVAAVEIAPTGPID